MSREERVRHLHDTVTRGGSLSEEEQAQLDAWYAEEDQQEGVILGPAGASPRLTMLHTQVETALAQLLTVTQRIQTLTVQNETLRREIAVLQRQLPLTAPRNPA
jgi:hypothetical protein